MAKKVYTKEERMANYNAAMKAYYSPEARAARKAEAKAAPDCPFCGGKGRISAYDYYKGGVCFKCNGTGKARK